jgi:glyoxylase-like metal-dependent hydrolase (beta-lactamase superfamily II)
MTPPRALSSLVIAALAAGGPAWPAVAQQNPNAPLDVVQLKPDIYMIAGAGGNITVHVGSQGLFVVDTGSEAMSAHTVTAIRRISDKPIRYIVNTSAEPEHTGGNIAVDKLGSMIPTRELIEEGAVIVGHEKVLNRMSAPTGKVSPTPTEAWPTSTFFVPQKDLYFNDQAVQLFHEPAAHGDGDVVVYFRRSDVIAAGDVFDKTSYPRIDLSKGGSISGEIDAVNHVLALAVAGEKEEGGTLIVPGHGRAVDEADVADYRDMLVIVRDRIRDMIKFGLTLERVKAAKPTIDYDPEYGASDAFVEAVYRSLRGTS